MAECTNELLKKFGRDHYAFINQIFGDQTVREIISETYPEQDEKYKFDNEVTRARSGFQRGHHHFLRIKTGERMGEKICSVNDKHQNPFKDIHDTLCQSYSLLSYFDIPIVKDKKKRQMDMIKMYRERILANPIFMNEFLTDISPKVWKASNSYGKTPSKNMTNEEIIENIHRVLNDWESYGYHYFIGNGMCPPTVMSLRKRGRNNESNKDNLPMTRRTRSAANANTNTRVTRSRATSRRSTRRLSKRT